MKISIRLGVVFFEIMLILLPISLYSEELPREKEVEVIRTTIKAECNVYRSEVEKYDWDSEIMLKIMELESGCRETVINDNPNTGDYSIGLFQINLYGANAKYRPSEEHLKIGGNNIAYAYELYSNGGYRHWTTFKKVYN